MENKNDKGCGFGPPDESGVMHPKPEDAQHHAGTWRDSQGEFMEGKDTPDAEILNELATRMKNCKRRRGSIEIKEENSEVQQLHRRRRCGNVNAQTIDNAEQRKVPEKNGDVYCKPWENVGFKYQNECATQDACWNSGNDDETQSEQSHGRDCDRSFGKKKQTNRVNNEDNLEKFRQEVTSVNSQIGGFKGSYTLDMKHQEMQIYHNPERCYTQEEAQYRYTKEKRNDFPGKINLEMADNTGKEAVKDKNGVLDLATAKLDYSGSGEGSNDPVDVSGGQETKSCGQQKSVKNKLQNKKKNNAGTDCQGSMSTGSLDGQVDSGFHPNRCCNTTDKTIENRVLSISAGKEKYFDNLVHSRTSNDRIGENPNDGKSYPPREVLGLESGRQSNDKHMAQDAGFVDRKQLDYLENRCRIDHVKNTSNLNLTSTNPSTRDVCQPDAVKNSSNHLNLQGMKHKKSKEEGGQTKTASSGLESLQQLYMQMGDHFWREASTIMEGIQSVDVKSCDKEAITRAYNAAHSIINYIKSSSSSSIIANGPNHNLTFTDAAGLSTKPVAYPEQRNSYVPSWNPERCSAMPNLKMEQEALGCFGLLGLPLGSLPLEAQVGYGIPVTACALKTPNSNAMAAQTLPMVPVKDTGNFLEKVNLPKYNDK